ncbi:deoxyguanosinetriphosphate triphosphohydrolase [Maridesulfovibrio sp.]|uniref:deoxyguanosinetriphosphate triphosphohydrolase n=1 Tax=Maridesulfovibrio sp. TaxID=2795000 RepID=UPI002A18C842|nr:deoxyguanosinetriphosphate triphosphohydrolase [Maridesulfovibrio sp.]
MQWDKLLGKQRIGKTLAAEANRDRSEFQKDFDRIIFSSAFRRLQDKTQVFPLSRSDYVRTRLTHSLETSSVGRSLGYMVGSRLIDKHGLDLMPAEPATVVATACLMHDIGNPPFGHSGEDAIRDWFECSSIGSDLCTWIGRKKRDDFRLFEGNAQGLRNVLALQRPNNPGGMQLTCATLAAFTKYPFTSEYAGSKKKFGIFLTEVATYAELAEYLGLSKKEGNRWARHPFAYLVEAADDICYHVVDLEDGYRLGLVSFDDIRAMFMDVLDHDPAVAKRIDSMGEDKEKVEFLRATAINALVTSSCEVFLANEDAILEGAFESSLTECIEKSHEFSMLKKVAIEKVYNSTEVIDTEAAAYEVLWKILDFFGQIVCELHTGEKLGAKSRKSIKLLPDHYKPSEDLSVYENTQKVVDYVSGMTDAFAVRTFNKITGISLMRR